MSHRYIIVRAYQCPHCNGTFEVRHRASDTNPPNNCYLCGEDVSGKKKRKKRVREVSNPKAKYPPGGIGTASKSVDRVYRAMESSSERRIADAADLLGVDRSSLNSMKFTNMKDNMREGDSSHVPAPAAQIQGSVVNVDGVGVGQMRFQAREQGAEYARATQAGPEALTGRTFRNQVVSGHQMRAHQVARSGQLNKK